MVCLKSIGLNKLTISFTTIIKDWISWGSILFYFDNKSILVLLDYATLLLTFIVTVSSIKKHYIFIALVLRGILGLEHEWKKNQWDTKPP